MNILRAAAANALDEVGVMIAGTFAVRPGFGTVVQPRFVSIVSIDGEIAFGSVKDVADGVGLCILRPQGLLLACSLLAGIGGESRGGHATGTISASSNLRLVVGNPVANFEL